MRFRSMLMAALAATTLTTGVTVATDVSPVSAWNYRVEMKKECVEDSGQWKVQARVDNRSEPGELRVHSTSATFKGAAAGAPAIANAPARQYSAWSDPIYLPGNVEGVYALTVTADWEADQGPQERTAQLNIPGDCTEAPKYPDVSATPVADCAVVGTDVTLGEGNRTQTVTVKLGEVTIGSSEMSPGETKRFSRPVTRDDWGDTLTFDISWGEQKGSNVEATVPDVNTCGERAPIGVTTTANCVNITTVVSAGEGDLPAEDIPLTLPDGSTDTVTLQPGESQTFTTPAGDHWGTSVTSTFGDESDTAAVPSDTECYAELILEATANCTSARLTVTTSGGEVDTPVTVTKPDGSTVNISVAPNGGTQTVAYSVMEDDWGTEITFSATSVFGDESDSAVVPTDETCDPEDPAQPGGTCTSLDTEPVPDSTALRFIPQLVADAGSEDVTSFINRAFGLTKPDGTEVALVAGTDGNVQLDPEAAAYSAHGTYTVSFTADIEGTGDEEAGIPVETVSCTATFVKDAPPPPTDQPVRVCDTQTNKVITIGASVRDANPTRYKPTGDEACKPDTPNEVETGGRLVAWNIGEDSLGGGETVVASAAGVNTTGLGSALALALIALLVSVNGLVTVPVALALRRRN